MTDVENTFIVVMHSSALGAGGEERALHNQTRNLLRALDMNAKGARVFRFHDDAWEEVIYDSFGEDMGHHPGHDEPFEVKPTIEEQLPIPRRLSMSHPRLQRMPIEAASEVAGGVTPVSTGSATQLNPSKCDRCRCTCYYCQGGHESGPRSSQRMRVRHRVGCP